MLVDPSSPVRISAFLMGAPGGNRNALKHGLCSAETIAVGRLDGEAYPREPSSIATDDRHASCV
jgi:hypothetical protein